MKNRSRLLAVLPILLSMTIACGKNEKSSAERDAEVQKALQQGAERERKMYEGMQKGVQDFEQKAPTQKEKQ